MAMRAVFNLMADSRADHEIDRRIDWRRVREAARMAAFRRPRPRRVEQAAARDHFIDGIARYVSKVASLAVSDTELRALRAFFTVADAVFLYEQIRDLSKRLEFEWRDEFLRYFPAAKDALPPVRVTEAEYERWEKENTPPAFLEDDIPM